MNPLITNLAFFAAGFGRYSASRTPAIAYSVNDCVVTNSIHGSPVRYAEAQAIVFKKYVLSCVSGLLAFCSPSAIVREVSKVIVDSIYGVSFRRAASHVSKKVFKAIEPPVAHSYSTPSVVFVGGGVFVCTSNPDAVPNVIDGSFAHPMRLSGGLSNLVMDATAGLSVARNKSVCLDNNAVTAIACAVPSDSSASGIFRSGCCNKSPVPDASVIYRFGHFVTSKLLTVKDAWRSAVRQIFGSYPSQAEGNFNTITLCMTVVNFHRGSSMRSQSKDATIAALSASK